MSLFAPAQRLAFGLFVLRPFPRRLRSSGDVGLALEPAPLQDDTVFCADFIVTVPMLADVAEGVRPTVDNWPFGCEV